MSRSSRFLAPLGALVLVSSLAGAVLVACTSDDSSDPSTDGGADGSVGNDGGKPPGDGSTATPTPPDASGLSLACSSSADCQLVTAPSNCEETVCSCPGLAINVDAAASWSAEVSSYAAACRTAAGDGGIVGCGVECVYTQPVCCAGTCMAVPGSPEYTCPASGDAGTDASDDAAVDAGADAHDGS
jgi:hypothetical protein